jgi:hypothetical protein
MFNYEGLLCLEKWYAASAVDRALLVPDEMHDTIVSNRESSQHMWYQLLEARKVTTRLLVNINILNALSCKY